MKRKNIFLSFFFLPFFLLLCGTGYFLYTVQTAPQVILAIKGYDPLDVFSGHYIQYKIDWEKTDCTQFAGHICPKKRFAHISNRYYLPAQAAVEIDRLMRAQNSVPIHFDMVFSYAEGREPVARVLLINRQKWSSYLKNERKK